MGAAHDDGDFAAPAATPAPARGGGGVYQVGGVPVEFPYKPYGTQLAFMGRVIATLDRGRRQGRSHALPESPTGTGRTLSLLCGAFAWQRHCLLRARPADPLLHGGAFVPDDTQQQPNAGIQEKAAVAKKKNAPTIYYVTRTHSQITQVVRELPKTMAILASRKHYSVNKTEYIAQSIDEECKKLLDDKVQGCPEFKNAQKLSRRPSLQIDGCYEVHDIEDLLTVGRQVKVSINGFLSCKTTAPHVIDLVLLCARTDMGKAQQGNARVAVEWSQPSLSTAARRSSPLIPHLGVCRSGEEGRKDLEEESRTR